MVGPSETLHNHLLVNVTAQGCFECVTRLPRNVEAGQSNSRGSILFLISAWEYSGFGRISEPDISSASRTMLRDGFGWTKKSGKAVDGVSLCIPLN